MQTPLAPYSAGILETGLFGYPNLQHEGPLDPETIPLGGPYPSYWALPDALDRPSKLAEKADEDPA